MENGKKREISVTPPTTRRISVQASGERPIRRSDCAAAQNTDRELYRETDSYFADSIHVTANGRIGINCGGYVIVMPLRMWHRLAGGPLTQGLVAAPSQPSPGSAGSNNPDSPGEAD